jgi:hypothetical protein
MGVLTERKRRRGEGKGVEIDYLVLAEGGGGKDEAPGSNIL